MVKIMCKLFILSLVGFTLGCSSVYDVKYDYDQKADFSGLETYMWLPIAPEEKIERFDQERIKNAVDAQLESKGFRMSQDRPDFQIAVHVARETKTEIRGYRPYWGVPEVWQYEEGTLILDFVDAQSNNLIWRGSASAELQSAPSPERRLKLIDEAVLRILKNFPPPS
jgi:hypothetical protein